MSLSTIYPFDTPANYTYDIDKMEVDGGVAKLKLQEASLPFSQTFDNDTGFTYDSNLAEFVGELVRQIDKRPTNAIFYASYTTNINGNWGNGNLSGSPVGNPIVENGYVNLEGGGKYVDYEGEDNADSEQTICIRVKFRKLYSGTPSEHRYLFSISNGYGNESLIDVYHHTNGTLYCRVRDEDGNLLLQISDMWNVGIGDYEFELNFDITAGASRCFINGTQFGTTKTDTGIRNSADCEILRIGADVDSIYTADFYIYDFLVFSTVQHTSNYTPDWSDIYETIYLGSSVILPEMEHIGDGSILSFDSFTTTEAGAPRYTLQIGQSGDYLYWNGSSWAVSDGTYAQANDQSTFNTNVGSLPVSGEKYGQFKIIFDDSNTQSDVDLLTATMTVNNGYVTDNPFIEPISLIEGLDSLLNFEKDQDDVGLNIVKYALYKDGTLYYHNGSDWVTSDGSYNQSNSLAEIVANKLTFTSVSIEFKWRAFLHSEDGSDYPEIDAITVTYDFSQSSVPLEMCLVYGYSLNPDNSPNTDTILARLNAGSNETLGNNQLSGKTIYIVPDINGYWEKELANNEDMEDGSFYYFTYQGRETKRVVAKQGKLEFNEMIVLTEE